MAGVTQDKEGRPWPVPGPDVDWWRSGAEADAEPDAPEQPPGPVLAWATPDEVAATWPGVTDADLTGRKATVKPAEGKPPTPRAPEADTPEAGAPRDNTVEAAEADVPEVDTAAAEPEPAEPEPTEPEAAEPIPEPAPAGRLPRRTTSPYDTPPRTGATQPPARPLPSPAVMLPPTTPVPVPVGALRQATTATAPDTSVAAMPVPPARTRTTRPTVTLQRTTPVRPGRRSWQARYRAGLRRRPWVGIPALLVLTMLAAFLAWVSAEPFWLAFGRGQAGTATVVPAADSCRADITIGETAFASNVDLAGIGAGECRVGATFPVQMLRADADRAYATDTAGLHLRWAVGLFLVLLCGLLIAWVTGATSFAGWRFAAAIALSVGGPAAIATALLFAAQT